MAATVYLDVDQGSDFASIIDLENDDNTPMDLSNYAVHSQFRKSYGSLTAHNFDTNIHSAVDGKIKLALSGDFTSSIKHGRYLYDVEILSYDGKKTRVIEGILTIHPEITKI